MHLNVGQKDRKSVIITASAFDEFEIISTTIHSI